MSAHALETEASEEAAYTDDLLRTPDVTGRSRSRKQTSSALISAVEVTVPVKDDMLVCDYMPGCTVTGQFCLPISPRDSEAFVRVLSRVMNWRQRLNIADEDHSTELRP